LGSGAFSSVYLVKEKDTEELYAMKVIEKKKLTYQKYKQSIINEKEVMKKLKHPFIAKLYYSFQTRTKLYFILEYITGGNLSQYIKLKNELTEDQARLYSAEIILALEYLHKNSIIYRDLKATNVMLDDKGHVKLVDFGLAKVMINQKAFTLCGTMTCIAPEVISKTSYTTAADWWTLVIYNLII